MNGNRLSKPVLGSAEARPVLISEVNTTSYSAVIAIAFAVTAAILLSIRKSK